MFRFGLTASVEEEKRSVQAAACWARVREVEEAEGRPFGEVVHDLRLKCKPYEIHKMLGVSRHFLYSQFGWAMDKIAYVERLYGAPLGAVVTQRRAQGHRMEAMAEEWGLATTTLYNAQKRH